MWGHKISPIGKILCGDIKFPLKGKFCVGTQNSENFVWGHKIPSMFLRGNFVWGHKIPPIGKILCGDIKFPL